MAATQDNDPSHWILNGCHCNLSNSIHGKFHLTSIYAIIISPLWMLMDVNGVISIASGF